MNATLSVLASAVGAYLLAWAIHAPRPRAPRYRNPCLAGVGDSKVA